MAHLQEASVRLNALELTRGVSVADFAIGAAGTAVDFEQYGIYYDDAERMDGRWVFVRRLFIPLYVERDRVTGDVLADRSALVDNR
jgi:hypothetical protein